MKTCFFRNQQLCASAYELNLRMHQCAKIATPLRMCIVFNRSLPTSFRTCWQCKICSQNVAKLSLKCKPKLSWFKPLRLHSAKVFPYFFPELFFDHEKLAFYYTHICFNDHIELVNGENAEIVHKLGMPLEEGRDLRCCGNLSVARVGLNCEFQCWNTDSRSWWWGWAGQHQEVPQIRRHLKSFNASSLRFVDWTVIEVCRLDSWSWYHQGCVCVSNQVTTLQMSHVGLFTIQPRNQISIHSVSCRTMWREKGKKLELNRSPWRQIVL